MNTKKMNTMEKMTTKIVRRGRKPVIKKDDKKIKKLRNIITGIEDRLPLLTDEATEIFESVLAKYIPQDIADKRGGYVAEDAKNLSYETLINIVNDLNTKIPVVFESSKLLKSKLTRFLKYTTTLSIEIGMTGLKNFDIDYILSNLKIIVKSNKFKVLKGEMKLDKLNGSIDVPEIKKAEASPTNINILENIETFIEGNPDDNRHKEATEEQITT